MTSTFLSEDFAKLVLRGSAQDDVCSIHSTQSSDSEDPFKKLDLVENRPPSEAHVSLVEVEGLSKPIALAEDLSGGCGGRIWEAARVMTDYCLWRSRHQPHWMAGKRVLELGSGTGLVGLAVAKGCQLDSMLLTDQM